MEIHNWSIAGGLNKCEGEILHCTTLKDLGRVTFNPGSPHGLHKEMHYLQKFPPQVSLSFRFLSMFHSHRESLHIEGLRLQPVKSPVKERLSRI
jgi:hypothetical protein